MTNPQWTEPALQFLQKCHVPERTVSGVTTEKWFLLKLMPILAKLIENGSTVTRTGVHVLVSSVASLVSPSR
jgi:hypothetical protein